MVETAATVETGKQGKQEAETGFGVWSSFAAAMSLGKGTSGSLAADSCRVTI